MIIRIDLAGTARGSLEYNFRKVDASKIEQPIARIIEGTIPYINRKLVYSMMGAVGNLNRNPLLKNRICHIKVSLAPTEEISDYKFSQISKDVITALGFSSLWNPHLTFRHYDTEHPHIHVVLSRTNVFGKTNPLNFSHYQCFKISRELEIKYGLVVALDQNIDSAGIRSAKFYERKSEIKRKYQSDVQQIRDVVISALTSSPTLTEYLHDLERNNVEVKFRIQQNSDQSLAVGVSYKLNTENPYVVMRYPALPMSKVFYDPSRIVWELCEWRCFLEQGSEKVYLSSSNHIRINNNTFPVRSAAKDCMVRAKSLGPGSEWFALKKKYIRVNEETVFSDLLIPERLQSGKRNVWVINGNEMVPWEPLPEKKAMLGIKENNLGYLQEAIELGVDFSKLYLAKHKQLENNYISKRLQAYALLQENAKDESPLLKVSLVKYRFDIAMESKYYTINKEKAFKYAIKAISEDIGQPWKFEESESEDRFRIGLERLQDGYVEEETDWMEMDIMSFFFQSKGYLLEDALADPDIKFSCLKDSMDYLTLELLTIDIEILLQIEMRIAKEMCEEETKKKYYQNKLEGMENFNSPEFRFILHMDDIDFTDLPKEPINEIIDNRLKLAAKNRVEMDKFYIPKHIRFYQEKLDEADRNDDISTILKLKNMPMLTFSRIDYGRFKNKISHEEYIYLENRVVQDESRGFELFMLQEGTAKVIRSTGEIIEKVVPLADDNQEEGRTLEHRIQQHRSPNRDQGLSM